MERRRLETAGPDGPDVNDAAPSRPNGADRPDQACRGGARAFAWKAARSGKTQSAVSRQSIGWNSRGSMNEPMLGGPENATPPESDPQVVQQVVPCEGEAGAAGSATVSDDASSEQRAACRSGSAATATVRNASSGAIACSVTARIATGRIFSSLGRIAFGSINRDGG